MAPCGPKVPINDSTTSYNITPLSFFLPRCVVRVRTAIDRQNGARMGPWGQLLGGFSRCRGGLPVFVLRCSIDARLWSFIHCGSGFWCRGRFLNFEKLVQIAADSVRVGLNP